VPPFLLFRNRDNLLCGLGGVDKKRRYVVQQLFNQVATFISQIVSWIGNILKLVWNWSFGQIIQMTQLSFSSLPLWKQVLYVVVIAALAYLIYRIAMDLLEALTKVFSAGVGLIMAIIDQLKPVVVTGLVAFGGAWIIKNITIPFLP